MKASDVKKGVVYFDKHWLEYGRASRPEGSEGSIPMETPGVIWYALACNLRPLTAREKGEGGTKR